LEVLRIMMFVNDARDDRVLKYVVVHAGQHGAIVHAITKERLL